MTLHLHHATRTDLLADGLAELLGAPLADPFATEVVVLPARGVERWLTQRLAHRLGTGERGGDGICAGVRFTSPHSLVSMLLARDAEDPWSPDRLVWPLLEVIDASLDDTRFSTLAAHLGHGSDSPGSRRQRRFGVARRLAGLFASYAVQRPALLTGWRAGEETDGAGGPLDDDLAWQAELWRRLVELMASEHGLTPPDERHASTLAALRAGTLTGLDLPGRLSLFGHTRLPATEVELLEALAAERDVHLWMQQASPALWGDLADTADRGPVRRRDDLSARTVRHPLLASLGRDARELRRTLGTRAVEQVLTAPERPSTLLGWLQHDLQHNQAPTGDPARVLSPEDRSVQVHAAHGPARQVDVLREVLVGLLEDDPTLEPRDILVMCPDIEGYAPLVQAGFGLADVHGRVAGHPAHDLRVRLADRALGATNPLLGAAATLVETAQGRLRATDVLDLAASAPVRARFGFTDDDLAVVDGWVREAGVRWGRDLADRGRFGLTTDANTWWVGLRRVLLGAAVQGSPDHALAGVLPLDDVGDGDLDLLGRFTEFVDRLLRFTERAERADTADDWTSALTDAVHQLTATAVEDTWQLAQFDREMARTAAGAAGTQLTRADVRALLAHRLRGRPTRSNFRTGTLTVCTMVPMRSVPHRVVALVGLDDGTFPRIAGVDGDDVLARAPLTGERDVRSEDRQLLLDAVCSATETLVVTYTGRSEETGDPRPPAVPLGELLDALDRTAAAPVRDQVLVEHPLQPFDEQNLVPGALTGSEAFTFDTSALAGARSARDPRPREPLLLTSPLPAPAPEPGPVTVSLSDLHAFHAHPVRAFLRHRLRVTTPLDPEQADDAVPISLEGLAKWGVGERLVQDVLAGVAPPEAMQAELMRGHLPPGELGWAVIDEVKSAVVPLASTATTLRAGTPRTLDVDIDLGDVRVVGTVADIFGNNVVRVGYSSLGAKQRLAGWIDALALAAGYPDENWTVHSLGRYRHSAQAAIISPLPEYEARDWLRDLVAVRARGLTEPLPLPVRTGLAWAEGYRRGSDADADTAAVREWVTPRFGGNGFPREDADAWHVRAFGPAAPFDVLATPLAAGEEGHGHRLGHYAQRVWGPLLNGNEQVRGIY